MIVDRQGRRFRNLRISLTSACNYACTYCVPNGKRLVAAQDELSAEAMVRGVAYLIEAAGIERLRITGGEPLISHKLDTFMRDVGRLGLGDISLTTNGQLLARKLPLLLDAGIARINVSLDTLDPEAFRRIARGGDLATRGLYALNVSSYNIGCFVLPFVQSFLPPEALVGVSMFDAGNCPVNSGVAYAIVSARSSGQRVRLGFVLDKLVHSVPFMTYLTLMVLSILGITLPEPVYQVASTVGGANTFLAMLMIGMLFEVRVEKEDRRLILEILAVRYGCSLAMAALVWVLPLPLLIRQVSVLAMMAPIPSVTMVYCEKCGCKPSLYGVLNSLSIAVSLLLTFPLLLVLHL